VVSTPATWRAGFGLSLTVLLTASCESPRERTARALASSFTASEAGDTDRAIALLVDAQQVDPRDRALVTRLAELQDAKGDPWRALRTLAALPDDVPRDHALLRVKARALIHTGDLAAAARILAASARSEGVSGASGVKGVSGAGGADALTTEWLDAVALEGSLELLIEYPELVTRSPTQRTLEILHRALVLGERWQEAAAVESDFERRFPSATKSSEMLLLMARRRNRADDPEAALRAVGEILARNPLDTAALVERALSLAALERVPEARHSLRLALAGEPDHLVARRLLDSLSKPARRRRETGGRG
jgi:Flp pilus assembly protein TadD